MKVIVAGEDKSESLGGEIAGAAKAMVSAKGKDELPRFFGPEASALSLRSSKNEAEYLDKLTTLMLSRTGVGTYDFYIPRKPGLLGSFTAAVRRVLWKLLKYQHDRSAFQQNSINIQLTAAIEFMRAEYEKKVSALEKKVIELQKKGN